MAGPVNVPAHQRPPALELAALSDEAYLTLRDFLVRKGPQTEPAAFVEQSSKALASQTRLGGQIAGMVIGLRSLVDRSAMSPREVAEGFADDVVTKKWVGKESHDILQLRLAELLQLPVVAVSAKAFSLSVGDESPFSDVRILSDVRPIFSGSEGDLELSGSVVVHHLVIEVNSPSDDLYCALSTADLLKLKRTVERALEKDKKLRTALRGSPIAPLESTVEPTEKES
jgi:hypothetical protein